LGVGFGQGAVEGCDRGMRPRDATEGCDRGAFSGVLPFWIFNFCAMSGDGCALVTQSRAMMAMSGSMTFGRPPWLPLAAAAFSENTRVRRMRTGAGAGRQSSCRSQRSTGPVWGS